MKLSIIIVNYNVKYFLEQCLCSVRQAIDNLQAEVIVVDNASTDGSINYLQPLFRWVKFINAGGNLGFGKANNLGLQHATGEYVLLLNPDTIIPEDSLYKCLQFVEAKQNAGAVGVRMLDGGGNFLPESKRSLPTPLSSFYKLSGMAALFPKSAVFNRYALGNLSQYNSHEVDVVSGAFFLCRRNLLQQLQGFDEDFFMYGEDVDLSYRIRQAGYCNHYFAGTAIIHFKGESSSKASGKYVKMFYEAMVLFVKKHYHNRNKWLLSIALHTAIGARAFLSFVAAPFKMSNSEKPNLLNTIFTGAEDDVEHAKRQFLTLFPDKKISVVPPAMLPAAEVAQAEVIFCLGELTYAATIDLLQQIKPRSVKWYGHRSFSMTGSHNKNLRGNVYVLSTAPYPKE
ncbi:glycosyltransferase family 2 protein [Foetidibacter luteolus]|uniref:glycosyltransferase family 2 protein n=1 Tax=Foetidibacter luteolus TaxID=2608880 RepID=UPI001A99BC67|nr:glycosyltransferase family 2 protein [Foetidibacter luteolus]